MILSYQQNRCLKNISQGMSYREAAELMHLSPRTIEHYVNIIRKKTGLKKRSQLVQWFLTINQIQKKIKREKKI